MNKKIEKQKKNYRLNINKEKYKKFRIKFKKN